MPFAHTFTLTPSESGLPAGWTSEAFRRELQGAAASYNQAAAPCASLQVAVAAPAPRRIAAEDGTSLVAFRSDQWCHNSRCGHLDTFPSRAMAMTETHAAGEADIELNALNFRFTEAAANANPDERVVPLRAVLMHEIGHVVGLEDRCVAEGGQGRHGAHAGVPDADLCRAGEAASVMFAPALNLHLSPLDVAALCAGAAGAGRAEAPLSGAAEQRTRPTEPHTAETVLPCSLGLVAGVVLWRFARGFTARRA